LLPFPARRTREKSTNENENKRSHNEMHVKKPKKSMRRKKVEGGVEIETVVWLMLQKIYEELEA
jgi:hypothetical protein